MMVIRGGGPERKVLMVRAKFMCSQVTKSAWGSEIAECNAVMAKPGDPMGENAQFNKATPNGKLLITIDNPAVQGFFKPGKEYYLDFTEVPPIATPT
jgi:hypothetical protein